MIDTVGIVTENRETAPGYRLLTLEFENNIECRSGQFAMLKPAGSFEPLLRRALAIYQAPGERRLSFLYQVMGRGTQALAELQPGGQVAALLPLGNSWLEAENGSEAGADSRAIVVAGGIGSASVLMLASDLRDRNVQTSILFGAGSASAAAGCGLADFQSLGLPLTVTTDDGSLGEKGFVTAPLERELENSSGPMPTVFACGPWVMMARTAEIAAKYGARCLVSLEAPMGCGFGVCVGCVFAVNVEGPADYHSYKRVCVDGSIFAAETVRWEVAAMSH